jgi:hypothetical protein
VPSGNLSFTFNDWVFNTVNGSMIDTSAQFNPAGERVGANFGKPTEARAPRIMQVSVRFSF